METICDWTDEHYNGLEKIDPQYTRFFNIADELNKISDKAVLRRLKTEMNLDWREEYNVGVKEIDSQHKKFLRIIKKMSHLYTGGGNNTDETPRLDKLLEELLEYARLHFESEERLMARYGYPLLDNQKKEHEIITSELKRQVESIRDSRGSTAKLIYFLVQWFIKHTVHSDKDAGDFIVRARKAQGFRLGPYLRYRFETIKDIFKGQPLDIIVGKETSAHPVG